MTTHGMSKSRAYKIWESMKGRCLNKNNQRYGGRGISICDRWLVFENFYADMKDPLTSDHTLDRIDNNGNYEPGNCRWATFKEQGRNRNDNVLITHLGEEKCVTEWAELIGVPRTTLYHRIKKGWPTELILNPKRRDRWTSPDSPIST